MTTNMSLWRRPNGKFDSYVMVDGRRHRISTGTSNKKLAEQIDRKHEEQLLASRFQVEQFKPQMTFAELSTKFIGEGMQKAWHKDRLKILLPYFGQMEIATINKGVVRQFRQYRHRQRKLTETTINRDLECLRHLLFWAVDQGYMPTNPLQRLGLERPRRKKRPVISLEEEALLLANASPHLREILICAFDTGMRRGEILNQLWSDVDFSRKIISVSRSKTGEGEHREIPMTKRLFELLSPKENKTGLVFTFERKVKDEVVHTSIKSIKTAWRATVRRAKVRPLRFKDCRTTFNSRLIEAGVIKDVRMELMGHSRNEDVNDLYSQIELPILREAIGKLEAWVEEQRRKEEKEQEKQVKHAEETSAEFPTASQKGEQLNV